MSIATREAAGSLREGVQAAPARPAPRRWLPRAVRRSAVRLGPVGLIVAAVSAVIVGMLLYVLWISVRSQPVGGDLTSSHYVDLYSNPVAHRAFLNTIGFAGVSLAVALAFGASLAWLIERTDVGGRALVYTVMTLGVLIPGFFTAMGWIFLLHPRIGVANQAARDLLGIDSIFNVTSLVGMGWVQGLSLAPVIFVMSSAAIRAIDSSLEEAAEMSGANRSATLRRVTFPLVLPSLLGAALFTFVIAVGAFDVPLIMGLSNRVLTFSTYLYIQVQPVAGLPRYGAAAAFGTFMIVVAVLGGWWYARVLSKARRYEVVTGKSYRSERIRLGRWRWAARGLIGAYILFSVVLPVSLLVWTSLQPHPRFPSLSAASDSSLDAYRSLSWSLVRHGARNTTILAVAVPTVTLVLAMAFSWTVLRSRGRFRMVFDLVAFLPHAVPRVVFALSALVAGLYLFPIGPLDLHGSVLLLVIVMAIVSLSFATRITNGSLVQLGSDLEEAARTSGASMVTTVRRIVLPLMRGPLVGAWLWLAMLAIRELTIPTMLFSRDNVTITVVIWDLWRQGSYSQSAAVTVVMIALLFPLVLLYWWRLLRSPSGPSPDPTQAAAPSAGGDLAPEAPRKAPVGA